MGSFVVYAIQLRHIGLVLAHSVKPIPENSLPTNAKQSILEPDWLLHWIDPSDTQRGIFICHRPPEIKAPPT